MLLLVAIVFFAIFAWVFLRNVENSEWHTVFYRAAARMVRHEKINVIEEGYNPYAYPPAMALFTVPMAAMPPFWGMALWFLVNVAATVALVTYAWKLTGGPSLRDAPGAWWGVFLLGLLLGLRFLIGPLTHQQFDGLIAALTLAGCWLLLRERSLGGAALIGVAASMKCTPLLFVPYLVWRRQFKAAAVVAVVATGLNLLPDLFFPQSDGRLYVQDFVSLSGMAGKSPGSWFADPTQNQSLGGMIGRLAQFGLPLHVPEGPGGWWTAETATWARGVFGAAAAALLCLTLWFCGKPFRQWGSRCLPLGSGLGMPSQSSPQPSARQVIERSAVLPLAQLRFSIEVAIVVTLMLLLSPMSGKAHFAVMLFPCFLVARLAVERPARGMQWLLLPLILFGPIASKDLIGKKLGNLSLYWSVPSWFLLVVLVGLWWAIVVVGRQSNDNLSA